MVWTAESAATSEAWIETRIVARRLAVMAESRYTKHVWMNHAFDQGINVFQSCIETLREAIRR